jgi:chaperonin GroEL (HSP60 family)
VFAEKVPAGDGWLHELKHDGFPIIVVQRTVTTFAGGSGIANVDVDPAEVVRAAFQGAASVAGLCTTTEAMT